MTATCPTSLRQCIHGSPCRTGAEVAVGVVVAVAAATTDLRNAIGFSSFGVLLYYAIANAAAWTLTPAERRPVRLIPALGLLGCLTLAVTLPLASVAAGAAVVAVGAAIYIVRRYLALLAINQSDRRSD